MGAAPHPVVLRRSGQSALGAIAVALLLGVTACSVSEEREIALGRTNAEEIAAKYPLVTDSVVAAYVQALGMRLARGTSRPSLPWRFTVVDSKDVNAFALPGGFVYVNRGLIEHTERMDELAGVLGHEIGHIVRRHSVQQLKRNGGTRVGVALFCAVTSVCDSHTARIAIDLGGAAWLARHSRVAEAEADSEAVANTVRAGVSPEGIPVMFQTMLTMRANEPGLVQTFFGSHPVEEDRIATTRHLVEGVDPRILRILERDDADFQTMKRRLTSLPKSPAAPALP
jgi:predicted Zn-dependent protease